MSTIADGGRRPGEPFFPTPSSRRWGMAYGAWAAGAVAASLAVGGLSAENLTRLMVIAFLAWQWTWRGLIVNACAGWAPRARFIVLGTALAAVVEGFHMISRPVFDGLRITAETPVMKAVANYALDLAFTIPAYVAILAVIWWFIRRYRYAPWLYALVFGLAQALGDGGLAYFAERPAMLAFLPYPMTNYHAMNVLPFLAIADRLGPDRGAGPVRWLAIPAVIATYFACGALIRWVGAATVLP